MSFPLSEKVHYRPFVVYFSATSTLLIAFRILILFSCSKTEIPIVAQYVWWNIKYWLARRQHQTVGLKSADNSFLIVQCEARFLGQQLTCSNRRSVMKSNLLLTYTLETSLSVTGFCATSCWGSWCQNASRMWVTHHLMDSPVNTNFRVLSSIVLWNIVNASDESVASPQLQIFLRCQLAALQPSPFNV